MTLTRSDTELKHPATQGTDYRTGNLEGKRDAVLDDFAPSIPEIDIGTFVESFLPPLPTWVDVKKIFSKLFGSGALRIGSNNRPFWPAFEVEPTKSKLLETATFDALRKIYDKVIENVSEKRTAILSLNPNQAPLSNRTHSTRPDGYMILTEPSVKGREIGKDYWEDLAVTMEFKKGKDTSSCIDNVKKQVFSMQQVMTYDPCRRFTFGITIENTDVRLWFCSRSMLAVSEKFDLNAQYMFLIYAFLSFTYASRTELGWDETMTPKFEDNELRYEINVGGKTFITVGRLLSDYSAHTVVGRATRVFKVRDLDDRGKTYVLKDVWLTKDRQPEHQIRKDILDDIKKELGEEDKNEVEKHLFTLVTHCNVQVKQRDGNWVEDDTHDVILHGAEFSKAKRFDVMLGTLNPNHVVMTTGHTPHISEYVNNNRAPKHDAKKITHRYHYRIVYKELADPLIELNQVSPIFHLLYSLVKVLYIFHRAGWVHRDISTGNVFLYENVFKLGDLEFAKKTGKDGEHDVRTGTLDFMALEVEQQRYLFLPKDSKVLNFFYHNSLHELESVWWLATWALFFHHPSEYVLEDLNGHELNNALTTLFPHHLSSLSRFSQFIEDRQFKEIIKRLHPDLHCIGKKLEQLRKNLKAAYKDFEDRLVQGNPMDHIENFRHDSLDNIHNKFKLEFENICTTYREKDIKLVRLYNAKRRLPVDNEVLPKLTKWPKIQEMAEDVIKMILENSKT